MTNAIASDLVARVQKAIRDASEPPWFPTLTAELADVAWCKLADDPGLTRASYGTGRAFCAVPESERRLVAQFRLSLPDGVGPDAIPVELLPKDLAERCAGREVQFFTADEIPAAHVSGRVEEALQILRGVPTVLPTVCCLVRALHLINPMDDEVDISFSDPKLPFSAFVSVPGASVAAGALRVAEALLHEAMHLQLTLVEAVVPLVMPSKRVYFSPWRNEYRTAQGVLHALYVFRVIDAFFDETLFEGESRAHLRHHADQRRATIAKQIREIRDFRECAELTADGTAFVERLLVNNGHSRLSLDGSPGTTDISRTHSVTDIGAY
jgi:HEXXH motif-containing protein